MLMALRERGAVVEPGDTVSELFLSVEGRVMVVVYRISATMYNGKQRYRIAWNLLIGDLARLAVVRGGMELAVPGRRER